MKIKIELYKTGKIQSIFFKGSSIPVEVTLLLDRIKK